jgi:putative flippase GtrA
VLLSKRWLPISRERLWEMAKYGCVGLGNAGLDVGLFVLLYHLAGLTPLLANTFSYSAGILTAFVLHRYWTFPGHDRSRPLAQRFGLFFVFSVIGLGLSNLTVWLLIPALPPTAAKIASLAVTYTWNYLTSRRFVYPASPARQPL